MTVHFHEENFPLFKGLVRHIKSHLQTICQLSEAFHLADFLKIPNFTLAIQTTTSREWKRL
jgi:hypothetical protein